MEEIVSGVIYIEVDRFSVTLPVSVPTTLQASFSLASKDEATKSVEQEGQLPDWYVGLKEKIENEWQTKIPTTTITTEGEEDKSKNILSVVTEKAEVKTVLNEESGEMESAEETTYLHDLSLTAPSKFVEKSTLIPLTQENLTLLVNSVLSVKVSYETAKETEDGANELSGETGEVTVGSFSLIEVLLGTPARELSVGGVEGKVYVDDDIAAFTLNSNALEVGGMKVENVPEEWRIPVAPETPAEETHSQLKEMVEGPLGGAGGEKQIYTVEIAGEFPSIKIGGGCLTYTEPLLSEITEKETAETPTTEGKEGEEENTVELGSFGLQWPDNGLKVWLSSPAFKALKDSVVNASDLTVAIQWSGVKLSYDSPPAKGKGWVPDETPIESCLTTTLSLTSFSNPGTTVSELKNATKESESSLFTLTMIIAEAFVEDTKVDGVKSISELIPPRKIVPQRPPRDVEADLQDEISSVVNALTEEYVKLFIMQKGNREMTFDDKRKRFFYSLNMEGLYHSLKEKLKPAIQRLARKKFASLPQQGDEERDIMLATLYSNLMENVAAAVNKKVKEAQEYEEENLFVPVIDKPNTISKERFTELLMLATDDESNGRWQAANSKHEERLYIGKELAKTCYTNPEQGPLLVYEATEQFAQFSLRAPLTMNYRNQGIYLCREAVGIQKTNLETIKLYIATMLEEGSVDVAKTLLESTITENNADENDTSHLLDFYALSVLVGKKINNKALMRKSLAQAVQAYSYAGSLEDVGLPRRTACAIMLQLGEFLIRYNLSQTAKWALEVYEDSEKAALAKAKERNFQPYTPVTLKVRLVSSYALIALVEGNVEQALRLGESAVEIDKHSGTAWLTLGNILYSSGNPDDRLGACNAYKMCILACDKSGEGISAQTFLRLASLYLTFNKPTEAKKIALRSCSEYKYPSTWLNVGIAAYRLNEIEEAEEALQEANTLDNSNPLIWGYLALLLLASYGQERLAEVSKCIEESLRLKIEDALLLREISLAYISIDYLQEAEVLLRRSIVIEPSFHTRKVLVDVLSAQSLVDKAAKEYEIILNSGEMNEIERNMVLEQYQAVLKILGKDAEAESLGLASPSSAVDWVES